MRRASLAALSVLAALLLAVGCASEPDESASDAASDPEPPHEEDETDDADGEQTGTASQDDEGEDAEGEGAEGEGAEEDPDDDAPDVDPAEVGANELGDVPILMYHRLREDGGGEYDRTPEGFRAELEWLFANDYVPVTIADLLDGALDLPAGTSPVVLTFDDSPSEHAQLDEDDEPEPDTALGILHDVAEDHDVEPVAVWSVLPNPFGGDPDEAERIMRWLHDQGHELANHTCRHEPLSGRDDDDVAEDVLCGERVITDAVPEAEVRTFTLPLGVWPDERSLAYEGTTDEGDYSHDAVLLVGANPAPSPFASDFDPRDLPRIRTGSWDGGDPDFESEFWLDVLEDDPDRRFVSDGDPDSVAFPEELADRLDADHEDRARPYARD